MPTMRDLQVPRGQVSSSPQGHKWSVIDAVLATMATPPYFDPVTIVYQGSTYKFRDAGPLGFTNPARLAYDEAILSTLYSYDTVRSAARCSSVCAGIGYAMTRSTTPAPVVTTHKASSTIPNSSPFFWVMVSWWRLGASDEDRTEVFTA